MAVGTPGGSPAGTGSRRFYAHTRTEGRPRDHLVPGAATLQDAAMIFAAHWLPLPLADHDGEVSVIVRDGETGEEQCFTVHLDSGDAEPCA